MTRWIVGYRAEPADRLNFGHSQRATPLICAQKKHYSALGSVILLFRWVSPFLTSFGGVFERLFPSSAFWQERESKWKEASPPLSFYTALTPNSFPYLEHFGQSCSRLPSGNLSCTCKDFAANLCFRRAQIRGSC